jgi:tRNA (cytidine32/uridine32-2'-O)-methyltransferase
LNVDDPLDRIVIVLWQTQDLVNIAGTVRAMKNFRLRRLRLVAPVEWDAWRIEGIAHDTAELVAAAQLYDTLEEALADCSYTVAMTARERRAKRAVGRPRDVAGELLGRAAEPDAGPAAILFGREDIGLTNEALDLCHRAVTIPTSPEHSSLNLAQAVLVMAYELWMAVEGGSQGFKAPRRDAPAASVQLLEKMFDDVEQALWAVDFFKSRHTASVMRTLRELGHRADLDQREAGLLRAIAIEVVKYIRRSGASG